MKHSIPVVGLLAVLSLSACDRPTVVNAPATPIVVPGPSGPPGAPGSPGTPGTTGDSVSNTTVIVTPAASAPASAPAK